METMEKKLVNNNNNNKIVILYAKLVTLFKLQYAHPVIMAIIYQIMINIAMSAITAA